MLPNMTGHVLVACYDPGLGVIRACRAPATPRRSNTRLMADAIASAARYTWSQVSTIAEHLPLIAALRLSMSIKRCSIEGVCLMSQSVLLAATQRSTERPLHITLLGPPQLTVHGTPLPLPRRQLRALLYRLAVALQPVAREHLCFLLWPDTPESTARRYLTVLLNLLRQ